MSKVSIGWVTFDWGGGSNYGPYSLRQAVRIAWVTRKKDRFDRQGIALSVIIQREYQDDEYTYYLAPLKWPYRSVWPKWEEFYREARELS